MSVKGTWESKDGQEPKTKLRMPRHAIHIFGLTRPS